MAAAMIPAIDQHVANAGGAQFGFVTRTAPLASIAAASHDARILASLAAAYSASLLAVIETGKALVVGGAGPGTLKPRCAAVA
jgi:hypothetical protein